MRALLLAISLAACTFGLDRDLQPGDVRGTVVIAGATQQPAPGTRVFLEGSRLSATSDAKGRFVLRGVPEGRMRLRLERDSDGDGTVDQRASLPVELHDAAIDLGASPSPRRDRSRAGCSATVQGWRTRRSA